ncbi:MAG: NAD(P)/FAD-dependent oxidoreductase [Candidatus Vogelbacteria bacterium]|nr:NAD(P)/FAD-dependent oxidoreductase [Candidatus Vogelbacteria bacterium]
MNQTKTRVLIIGAGFGGVAAALELVRAGTSKLEITLISNKPHFEYYPALYRVVTGRSPLEVCIPLSEIFRGRKVEVVIDEITALDPGTQTTAGLSGRRYSYDYAVLALGSETAYFNIPGLREFSFGFKSIQEALRLEKHLQALFRACAGGEAKPEEKVCLLHFVVVGAGPSGVELTGELAEYLKQLARHYRLAENLITIDLFEGASRILPALPETVSRRASQRLRALGVNIFVNRPLVKEEAEQIMVRGLQTKTETVIWTAGIKPNSFFQKITGLTFDQRGRVMVNEYLRAKNQERIFVIGDGASTPFTGLAQTAIYDGRFVAANLIRLNQDQKLEPYRPKPPDHAIPIGRGWGLACLGPITISGRLGWLVRRAADLRYFLSILPVRQALLAFRPGKKITDHCPICGQTGNH